MKCFVVGGAEVAEIGYTAFTSKTVNQSVKVGGTALFTGPVTGRLIVRRVKELNPKHLNQPTLFDTWRFHAFFTTVEQSEADTVTADQQHRRHAIIEQVHADLKSSALAHLPSGKFTANAAWLVAAVMAFNLTRAAAHNGDPALDPCRPRHLEPEGGDDAVMLAQKVVSARRAVRRHGTASRERVRCPPRADR